jgi:hypothetical protein
MFGFLSKIKTWENAYNSLLESFNSLQESFNSLKESFNKVYEMFINERDKGLEWLGMCMKYEEAIRKHRDQKGDDRCWMDDEELYKILPEGYTPPERDSCVELELCKKFIATRHNPGTSYISPERRIEELEEENRKLKKELAEKNRFFGNDPYWLSEVRGDND